MENLKVSFIIPVYNSASTLDSCLNAIFHQDYPLNNLEVIVVDNGSTDNSISIASKYNVMILSKPDGTISAVRNYGAANARGDILGFVDSDCIIGSDWLKEAIKTLKPHNVGATGSGYLTPGNYTWVEKAWLMEAKGEPFKTAFLPAGNFIMKAEVFKEIGGFNERLITSEDSDICTRIKSGGYEIMNSPAIRNVHLGNSKTIKQFVAKEYWYGRNILDHIRSNPLDIVFISSLAFLISLVLLLIGSFTLIFNGNGYLFIFSLVPTMSILATVAYRRVKKSHKYAYFVHIMLLYALYFLSRICALINAVYQNFSFQKRPDHLRT